VLVKEAAFSKMVKDYRNQVGRDGQVEDSISPRSLQTLDRLELFPETSVGAQFVEIPIDVVKPGGQPVPSSVLDRTPAREFLGRLAKARAKCLGRYMFAAHSDNGHPLREHTIERQVVERRNQLPST
jgi:hypothetical protein